MEMIELINIENGSKIGNLKFRTPSCKVKDTLIKEQSILIEKLAELDKKYELDTLALIEDEKTIEGLTSVAEINKVRFNQRTVSNKLMQKQTEVDRLISLSTIRKFTIIADDKNLTTAEKEMFKTDVEDDFWQEQDLEKITACVDFFMGKYKKTTNA